MKKKLVPFIVIVLIAGGVVFLRGWLQLAVPLGSCAVVRSKTHGLRAGVVSDGGFDWVWYRIIPGNTTLSIFSLQPSRFHLEFSGALPQAETLTAFTGIPGNYLWTISGDCVFSLRPESLSALVVRYSLISQEDFNLWLNRLTTEIRAFAQQRLTFYFESAAADIARNFEAISKDGTSQKLCADILRTYPYIINLECRLIIGKLPDFAQWETARTLYTAYLERQRTALQGDVTTQAARKIASQFRFDELSRYGELLTKYPVLLEYLDLEQKLEQKSEGKKE